MKYQLTEKDIELFRELTPLEINGELIPFKIVCEGKFHQDPRGNSKCVVYLTDFTCTATYMSKEAKQILQNRYVQFMSDLFEDYAEDYQAFLEQKNEQNLNV